jgi:hypothetical protein
VNIVVKVVIKNVVGYEGANEVNNKRADAVRKVLCFKDALFDF